MKRCQTKHKLFYCWYIEESCGAIVDTVKPDDFESLHLSDTVTAPNEDVARVVYQANLRINRGRK